MTLAKSWKKHVGEVQRVATKLNGITFNLAPFDILDKKTKQFYEIKTASKLNMGHSSECRISLSADEVKFGTVFKDKFTIMIAFDRKSH